MTSSPPPLPKLLPDFAIIGAMKAGTTTLYRYLLQHPDVGMSRMKETNYFSQNLELGENWYRQQFDPGFSVYGEASPNYTKGNLFPRVPETLSEASPSVRLIFVARDPVDRLVSHYRHSWLLGHMAIPPAELVSSKPWSNMIDASRYHKQMQHFLEHFSREQLLILDFDELRHDAQAILDSVSDHIGVARYPVPEIGAQNEGKSLARMPRSVQRLWQSRAIRRLDPLISRGTRDMARKVLSRGPERTSPELTPDILEAAAEALVDDAQAFRKLSGLPFENWTV